MLMLESARYLGTNQSSVYSGGVYISLTKYQEEILPIDILHAHENPHLTLLLQGGTQEKWKNGLYERAAGDIVFYPAGEPHHNRNTISGSKNINIEFERSFLKNYDLNEQAIELSLHRRPKAKFLLLNAYRELTFSDCFNSESIHMLLLHLIQAPNRLSKKGSKNQPVPEWIIRIRECLQDRWNETVTLNELSRVAGVHPITISKFFPQYFSCTLGEYLRRIKTEKALILVKTSKLSLLEIAHQCGFSDQSHFIRVFKRMTGFLPKDFRKL
jgi:AraC family transcriptional regulator